jgi:hypothetical protein
MTKHFTFEVLDDDGILRDGETRTHRMMMRDSKTLTPLEIADAATKAVMARDSAAFASARRPGFHYADSAVDSRAEARAANRQASYDAYDREISTAWQCKAPVVTDDADPRAAWHDARNASRDAALPPAGLYPSSSNKVESACTINGRPGHLKAIAGQDGWLECRADDGSTDSRTADAHRAVMDAAYNSYDSEIADAWRKPAQF